MSIAAIATHMAIEYNFRILVLSTVLNDNTLETCYWEPRNEELIKEQEKNIIINYVLTKYYHA